MEQYIDGRVKDFWRLPPVLGELELIDDMCRLVIIFYPQDTNSTLKLSLNQKDVHGEVDLNTEICDISQLVQSEKDKPTRMIINYLVPNCIYLASWSQNDQRIYQHEINTYTNVSKIVFVSCDLLEGDCRHSMWKTLNNNMVNIPNNLKDLGRNLFVHLGDQVYMDKIFNRGYNLLRHDIDEADQNILREMRERYNQTWSRHHNPLSNMNNLMIWDDHEITNDLILDEENDPRKLRIADLAVQVYEEYQESLHLTAIQGPHRSWYKLLSSRNIHNQEKDGLLVAIERTSTNVDLSDVFKLIVNACRNTEHCVRRLILCFSSGPIPGPQGFWGNFYHRWQGRSKFWDPTELKRLYCWLLDWITRGGYKKEVLLVGGDFHFGLLGRVSRGEHHFNVMISSPITNHPALDRAVAVQGLGGHQDLGSGITFTTTTTHAKRCYGHVDLNGDVIHPHLEFSHDIIPKNPFSFVKSAAAAANFGAGKTKINDD